MLIKIFILLSILSTSFAETAKPDPCAAELKKFCEPGVINEGRWACLGKKLESLSKECAKKIQDESSTVHHSCYIPAIAYCKAEFGDTTRKHYHCLAMNSQKLPPKCLEMIVGMRSKGHEFKAKIRDACAADFDRHCPGMNETQQTNCLGKAYKAGTVSNTCKKILDVATKPKK